MGLQVLRRVFIADEAELGDFQAFGSGDISKVCYGATFFSQIPLPQDSVCFTAELGVINIPVLCEEPAHPASSCPVASMKLQSAVKYSLRPLPLLNEPS